MKFFFFATFSPCSPLVFPLCRSYTFLYCPTDYEHSICTHFFLFVFQLGKFLLPYFNDPIILVSGLYVYFFSSLCSVYLWPFFNVTFMSVCVFIPSIFSHLVYLPLSTVHLLEYCPHFSSEPFNILITDILNSQSDFSNYLPYPKFFSFHVIVKWSYF